MKRDNTRSSGLTLKDYARAKRLPVEFLKELGLGQIHIDDVPVVRIPYFNVGGEVAAARFRLALSGDARFRWRSGSKLILYGLWRLAKARKAGHVVLCEGESDAQTLWFYGIPALGLPGANSWKEEWASHLEGIATIYVVVEPDKGGEAVIEKLRTSSIRERVQLVRLKGVKDPSALHLKNPRRFQKRWDSAVGASTPWSAIEGAEVKKKRESAWALCKELALEKNILRRFEEVLKRRGAIGIGRNAKIVYLALTSRLLDRLVSIGLKGPSSAGKSYLLKSVLAFFPSEAFYELTAMSEKALIYSEEPLRSRFVILYEAAALNGEWAAYFVRSLLSEGRLVYDTVEKTSEGMRPRRIEREGPTGLITTTTWVSLHPENETRLFSLRVSDSQDQTRRIMASEGLRASGKKETVGDERLLQSWHALQRWLASAEYRVVVPFAPIVAALMPPVATRLRRDFPATLSLVKAHALLHQASRGRDPKGRIVATIRDYAVVRKLIRGVIAEAAERSVSKTVRETAEAVQDIIRNKPSWGSDKPSATVMEVAQRLRLDRSAALRRIRDCINRGFLEPTEPIKRGQLLRVRCGDPLPDDKTLLPPAKAVRRRLRKAS